MLFYLLLLTNLAYFNKGDISTIIYINLAIAGLLILKNINIETESDHKDVERIQQLIKQTSRWSLASQQDNNVFIANLHANYGVGYLQALKDIYREEEIQNVTGIDLLNFSKQIVDIQDSAARRLVSTCPDISAKNKFLASLAGE